MKTLQVIIVCVLASVSVSAQTHFPFIESGKTWADITIFDNTGTPVRIWTDYYKFGPDTVFEGIHYYPLYSCHRDSTLTNWVPGYDYYWEDSNKVYKIDFWGNETILYDFNLVEGDSVYVNGEEGYFHVSYVDSTMICGSYRKTIHFSYPLDIWIEGIGSLFSTFDPIHYYYLLDNMFQLLCVNDSTCQLYQNPAYSTCFVDTIISGQNERTKLNPTLLVSPNPVEESCNVIISESTQLVNAMLLFNSQGDLVRKESLKENSFVFERKNLPSGIYLMRIIIDKIVLNKKIILN